MPKDYAAVKGRGKKAPFFLWPKEVTNSREYFNLNGWDVKLINDLGAMYYGTNNGDLSAAWKIMEKRGWKSPGTLHKAIRRTLATGFLILTRQGGRNYPSLYAISFFKINECDGKIDVDPTQTPPHTWRKK